MIVAGFGFNSRATAKDFAEALDKALAETGLARRDVSAFAALEEKVTTPALQQFATEVGAHLVGVDQDQATEIMTVTFSKKSFEAKGLSSVAECAALAAATSDTNGMTAELVIPRIIAGAVTCALAKTVFSSADTETEAVTS
ncbi:cobalamin biosynthesis protein [Notoacmeibacter ruber]|uniref:Precorrin methylase n=1 Tax=Notoacmeibacter ruber TaxID=2670375 RepID=A0A3L7JC90_9HYPH|nr:cobalamin biosynthesis protein [Notoacmeibacter ruber]RLQ88266.1 precorrin methylase [Notoacmeibacter ruber]